MLNLYQDDFRLIATLTFAVLAVMAGGTGVWLVRKAVQDSNENCGFGSLIAAVAAGLFGLAAALCAGVLPHG